jgi:hypothetical protein
VLVFDNTKENTWNVDTNMRHLAWQMERCMRQMDAAGQGVQKVHENAGCAQKAQRSILKGVSCQQPSGVCLADAQQPPPPPPAAQLSPPTHTLLCAVRVVTDDSCCMCGAVCAVCMLSAQP